MTKTTVAGSAASQPGLGCQMAVVIVNYKRADDTIECLESLLRSTIPLVVAVVDNASGDDSLARIAAWAAGSLPCTPASADMAAYSQPVLSKPVPLAMLDAPMAVSTPPRHRLNLIQSDRNGGFAAGNNLGLRHVLQDPAITCVWLLNNDTVVAADAAAALLNQMQATPRVGMCGTSVRYYWRPDRVQALNGYRFSAWTGQGKAICGHQPVTRSFDRQQIIDDTDFVLGASLCVSRAFINQVGLMHEDYFLYFEEIDWAIRNRRLEKPLAVSFAAAARVFHKEGGSIGSSGQQGQRSALSEYWLTRSRMLFIRRHFPWLWPWHLLFSCLMALRRALRRQPEKAAAIFKAVLRRPL
ncbi:MAG: glycosyltransferase family 2 protein [Sphingomonadales bacterium]